MPRQCDVLRVFTRGVEGGNPLGVVSDVSGLDAEAMQAIAADLGYPETIFLEWRHDLPTVRIFTPATELAFAGHPLVGMTWMLNETEPGSVSQIECGIGLVNIGVDLQGLGWQLLSTRRSIKVPLWTNTTPGANRWQQRWSKCRFPIT